ncbi:MAG: flagellar basal body L-ring protein FlgH [Phycisphaerae bacterium]|nr:flagellar basal body L-ring protein FlgH [Phycisphaerae bacterium]
MRRAASAVHGALAAAVAALPALGQSQLLPERPVVEPLEAEYVSPLQGVSLFTVRPPKPREFKIHDLVTILVEESSQQTADQSLKTDKKYDLESSLNGVIDPWKLLELQLRAGDLTNLKLIDAVSNQKFAGKGSFQRNDRLSMKIQAEIIDVKPNGTLVLEARKTIDKNKETQATVLTGVCRQQDVTENNTVLSSQLASLNLVTRNEGQVNETAKKGLVPRVLEALFAF